MSKLYWNISFTGVWWRRGRFGRGWSVMFPWKRPIFSERYGFRQPELRLGGFRLFRLEAVTGQAK